MKIDLENSNRLYYSLKEVALHFEVNKSLLIFWETEFDIISPRKTDGGTRQYTKQDIENISVVYHLVKEKGMTLEGARQTLKQKKDETTRKVQVIQKLEQIKKELEDMEREFDM
ncbi:DNA-binding transcriptional MerR regulator [Dysgonomonas sp. PFB1-18]|uniref:MerR family transcriptional regulator n=1 Tax=unclassified Dysgonomonas TaxID=2630389 RepID=UPI0024741757|nr:MULTISPECIES: MerR family transcriptional regulator [unclassified Dysgonomonas]MDH6309696.1 DNA-binding transcriptional MerR regulator [Dysgonomonas sp. PF1-14]MDH6339296.1 DNA-binding transcriptional MerR regulator [Dysgonomonas sp. PF1-16]MDH6380795.1 DNA-binding transcriptional MerR regulator [Dysgonomonas sp. PFB1-18]MDH6398291.1 DNA-binding transcriptional MerR regulator [Dysgonomonas sp. PF1-23]